MEHVVAAILQDVQGKLLILKRAASRETFPNTWSFISGTIEEGEEPRESVIRELKEELGEKVRTELLKEGNSFEDTLSPGDWTVYPFLFRYLDGTIVLDREHSECRWIEKEELKRYEHVPGILLDLEHLGL